MINQNYTSQLLNRDNWPPSVVDGYYWAKTFDQIWIVCLVEDDKIWLVGDDMYYSLASLQDIIHTWGYKIDEPAT